MPAVRLRGLVDNLAKFTRSPMPRRGRASYPRKGLVEGSPRRRSTPCLRARRASHPHRAASLAASFRSTCRSRLLGPCTLRRALSFSNSFDMSESPCLIVCSMLRRLTGSARTLGQLGATKRDYVSTNFSSAITTVNAYFCPFNRRCQSTWGSPSRGRHHLLRTPTQQGRATLPMQYSILSLLLVLGELN